MDENERKKWIVSRIDRGFEIAIKFNDKNQAEFQELIDQEMRKFVKVEKATLSVTGFFISIIFGVSALKIVEIDAMSLIGMALASGIAVYLIVLVIKNKARNVLEKIFNAIHTGHSELYYPIGYFHGHVFDLEELDAEDLILFNTFLEAVFTQALDLTGYLGLEKNMNSFFLSKQTKAGLKKLFNYHKDAVLNGAESYIKYEKEFKAGKFLKEFIEYGEILKDFKEGKEVKWEMSRLRPKR